MADDLAGQFSLAEDEIKDALNYARGHLLLGDISAALNSTVDAQVAVDRLVELLEEAE